MDDPHNWNPVNAVLGPFGPTHNAQQTAWPYTSEAGKVDNPGEGKSVDIPNSFQGPFAKHSNAQAESWPYNSEAPKTENPGEGKSVDIPNSFQGPFAKHANVQKGAQAGWPNPEYEASNTPHPNFPTGPYVRADELPPRVVGFTGKAAQWGQEIDGEWTSHPNFPVGPYGHAHEGAIGSSLSEKPHKKKSHKKGKHSKKYKKIHKMNEEIKDEEAPSDPNCNSADGCLTDTVDPYTRKKDPPFPHDYKVPNLGIDHDIKDT